MFWKGSTGLRNIPTSSKIAVTAFLILAGIGYLLGFLNVVFTYSDVDESPGLSVQDIRLSFYGKRETTKLEKTVDGSMREYFATDTDYRKTKKWLGAGGSEEGFAEIKSVFDASCTTCHSKDLAIADTVTEEYEDVAAYLKQDTGKSVSRLISLSHSHVLGTLPIIFILTFIFSFTTFPEKLKAVLMGFSFAAIVFDIGSWWLAKLSGPLAVLLIFGGISLALSFFFLVVLSLYDLWLKKPTQTQA